MIEFSVLFASQLYVGMKQFEGNNTPPIPEESPTVASFATTQTYVDTYHNLRP